MTLGSITSSFIDGERRDALKAFQRSQRKVLSLYGLAGSSAAVALAAFPLRKDAPPMLVVGDSADDAGYIYHDLTRLCGDQAVAMFPSGYRRDIRYGQADGPSEILRTEALNRWHAADGLRFVVTYPEAIAERVASRTLIDSHTIRFDRAKETDMTEAIIWLRENGFAQVDYVYEPGQFASRGSILDIFGYNSELPLRIDFFGDEIDSIRRFNVETQLSEERLESVAVTSGVAGSVQGESLLRFIPEDTLIALRDEAYTAARVRDLSGATLSANALIAGDTDSDAMSRLVDPDEFDS
ncbi:MAG: transcription-repair coupling factor, partial [Paramuribaculum sp.]|nr:transcription-repair coupling factor [Paramuribaculum sp.]